MNFHSSKNLAGVGAILMFASIALAPVGTIFVSGFVALVGLALLLIGARNLAQYYREPGIFNNMLYGSIIGIVGSVASAVIAAFAVLALLPNFLTKVYPGWNGDVTTLPNFTPDTTNLSFSDVAPFLEVFLTVILIIFIFILVATLFYRRSLSSLHQKSGIGLFGSTSTVLLVGAVLTIILIGVVIVWIAVLLTAIAFFQMKPPPEVTQPQYTIPATPPTQP